MDVMFRDDEQRFQQLLKESDAPFLGVLGENLEEQYLERIAASIQRSPGIEDFSEKLRQYPALLGSYLSHEISVGFASSGRYEVYPAIREVLLLNRDLTTEEKEVLWKAFRTALTRLGLPMSRRTSGSHYMADTYTQHLGVPTRFLEPIASKMLAFAKKAGLPSLEDDSAVRLWQQSLSEYLQKQPMSVVAKNAIAMDEDAYYSRAFLTVYRNHASASFKAGNRFENAVLNVLNGESQTSRQYVKARIPTLLYKQGQIGLRIPGCASERFAIKIGDADIELDYASEDWFFALPDIVAKKMLVSNLATNLVFEINLWPHGRANEILMFDEAGHLVSAGHLGQVDPIQVRPGTYTVVSRFIPEDVDVFEIWDEPPIYEFELHLSSGAEKLLRYGPAVLHVCAATEPTTRITGQQKTSLDGSVLRWGSQLLEVEIPSAWEQQFGLSYELRLRSSQHDEAIHVVFDLSAGQHTFVLDIGEEITRSTWHHGLHQVSIEISRFGERRAVHRKSTLFWKGLITVTNALHFSLSEAPKNLKTSDCLNVRVQPHSIEFDGENTRLFTLSFDVGYRHTKTLQWSRSGIFIEVEQQFESGSSVVCRKQLGESETAGSSFRKDVIVYADVPGVFSCGDWIEHCTFDKKPLKRIGLGFLANRINDGNNQLLFTPDGTDTPIVLLSVVKPHHADSLNVTTSESLLTFTLIMPSEADSVILHGVDLLSGQKREIKFASNSQDWEEQQNCKARGFCEKRVDDYKQIGVIDLSNFINGAWKFDISVSIDGLIGKVQNAREDNFAFSVFWSSAEGTVKPEMVDEFFQRASESEVNEVLIRAQRHLRPCYAPDTWVDISWIATLWRRCLLRLKDNPADAIHSLADVCCELPDTSSSLGWTLQLFAGAVCPEVYCQPARIYGAAPQKKHPVARAFRLLHRLDKEFFLIGREFLHPSVVMSFSNLRELSQAQVGSVYPRKLSLKSYPELMARMYESSFSLDLNDDKYSMVSIEEKNILSPEQWSYAKTRLGKNYDFGLSGNQLRRGRALSLCRHVRQSMFNIPSNLPFDVAGQKPVIRLFEQSVEVEIAQRQENLDLIEHFVALFAFFCRLSVRQSDAKATFLATFKKLDFDTEPVIGYILQLADELLAVYLILWEIYFMSQADVRLDSKGQRVFRGQKTA